jgi:hypothetical protein
MSTSITIGGITITPEELQQLANAVTQELQTTSKDPSQYPLVNVTAGISTLPVFRQNGNTFELVRLATAALRGNDGRNVELRLDDEFVQWRMAASGTTQATAWTNLIPIQLLQQPAAEALELYAQQIESLRGIKFDDVQKTAEGLEFYADGQLVAGPVDVGSAGGSGGTTGGGGSSIKLQNLSGASSFGVAQGTPVTLLYYFESLDTETGETTGEATAEYYVAGIRVATRNIRQGEIEFDVTPFLTAGLNACRIRVTDSYGAQRTLNINVTVVAISLSSTFNDTLVYDTPILFPYTPKGAGNKTIHFELDGIELFTLETTATNRQLNTLLPEMTHGAHTLKVRATMDLDGLTLSSQTLTFAIIYVSGGNNSVIIASTFDLTHATQYDHIAIPYQVYSPAALTAAVTLRANGETVANLIVDRTRQTWSYRIPSAGELHLEITAADTSRTFTLHIDNSTIDSQAETEALELYLSSNGRSNSEINPAQWTYNAPTGIIAATLTGFNFVTNGWIISNDAISVLRINAGAQVVIPFKPFSTDLRGTGKTIEFEFATRDVENYDAIIVSCMNAGRGFQLTAQEALFRSDLSHLSAKYKDGEHVRMSFVVETMMQNRLIYIYINGVKSGVTRYSTSDNFAQTNPLNITLGSTECTVDVYNIRSYAAPLNDTQIINNYIADTSNVTEKLAIYDRNQVCDTTGDITYALIAQTTPCMTIIGDLPSFKGDKKTVEIIFENRQNPSKSFTSTNVQIDVQGTSSQYYPRKNFKTKHNAGFYLTESGETVSKYNINDNDIAGKVLCEKTDYAESSGTHNTGLARFINDLLKEMNIKTPPQQDNDSVRTTVDGYPTVMFHRANASAPTVFVGKYNMNYDKDSQEVFGFTDETATECWEFLNNTSDLCLFKSDDFSGDWQNDLEARYPDGLENPANIQALWTWVVSCIGNTAKFKTELEQHFNKPNILSYYLITEMFGMVDQRAKNMFVTSWGNEGEGHCKWRFIFYDNDTALGINNEGLIAFGYNIETEDIHDSGHVWNGWNSELWILVKAAFHEELAAMYAQMRASLLTYQTVSRMLNEEQCARWCEVVYNMDGHYKYIQPLIDDGNGSFLYALQGSRLENRKWWLSNRFNYMDSKYNAANFLNDYITMRLYTPTLWNGVEPNADFTLTPYTDTYLRVKYGSYIIDVRATAGSPATIQAPNIQFNDTETIIYGASTVKGTGNLAAKYAGTVDISNAKKLTELIIGSNITGYDNRNLHSITLGNNTMLKKLDVQNCSGLSEPIDVAGCENIEEIYAGGTALTAVILPPAGNLKKLALPPTIANLTLKNQPIQETDLLIDSTDNISTLVMENLPNIDIWTFALNILQSEGNKLERLRLIGIHVTDATVNDLILFDNLTGLNEFNITTPHAIIAGTIHFDVITDTQLNHWNQSYPDLTITYDLLDFLIEFEDPLTEQLCVELWDTNGDGRLSRIEAANVTDITPLNNTNITKFNELKYFTGLQTLINPFFQCNSLTEVTFPPSVKYITDLDYRKPALKTIRFDGGDNPDTLFLCKLIDSSPKLSAPISTTKIYLDRNCAGGFPPNLSSTHQKYTVSPFTSLNKLTEIIISDHVTVIPDCFLSSCHALKEVIFPASILSLNSLLFASSGLSTIVFNSPAPPAAVADTFGSIPSNALIYVPDAALNAYKEAPNWSSVADKIKPLSEKPLDEIIL